MTQSSSTINPLRQSSFQIETCFGDAWGGWSIARWRETDAETCFLKFWSLNSCYNSSGEDLEPFDRTGTVFSRLLSLLYVASVGHLNPTISTMLIFFCMRSGQKRCCEGDIYPSSITISTWVWRIRLLGRSRNHLCGHIGILREWWICLRCTWNPTSRSSHGGEGWCDTARGALSALDILQVFDSPAATKVLETME